MPELVGALDQGTTSTRFVIFDHDGNEVARSQRELPLSHPHTGWVEQDATAIWRASAAVIEEAMVMVKVGIDDLVGIGIANQRETSIIWERRGGEPLAPAIGWQDVRSDVAVAELRATESAELIRLRTGLPVSTYPSATKLAWMLDNVEGARAGAERGDVLFGTVDSWLVWKMTGEHITDVTNASRTMLMDLTTLSWDDELLEIFRVPQVMLPRIHGSTFGGDELTASSLDGTSRRVAITGLLGDQQSALIGHRCFEIHDAKNTYGTGGFLLVNSGGQRVVSPRGLISTVAYQFGEDAPKYALEGAVAMVGAAVRWLQDQLGIISSAAEIELLAESVPDTAGVYFVPAFAGLYAPYWRGDARGTILGLSQSHTRAHLARAVLEAIGFQTLDVVQAIEADLGSKIDELRVDGGVSANSACMQLQANILGVSVVRDGALEATALGAAFAAGLGAGFWTSTDELPVSDGSSDRRFDPQWSEDERQGRIDHWRRAVRLSIDWADGTSRSQR